MSTELIPVPSTPQVLSVYDRIADPLDFVDRMGKVLAHSGACGCQTEAEGKLVALACLCERKSPFDLDRTYHLIQGKLSMKPEVMLAKLRQAGGKHTWIKDGRDGQEAEIELTFDGQTIRYAYTMEDAKTAKLVKEGGGWTKNPANMLRARAISNAVKMIAPEITAGLYTPEEIEDFSETVNGNPPPPRRSPEQVASRREELQRMQSADAVDSTPVPVSEPQAQQPPFETERAAPPEPSAPPPAAKADEPPETVDAQLLKEIDEAIGQLGMTREQFEERLRKANPEFTSIADLVPEAGGRLLANLHSKISLAHSQKKT